MDTIERSATAADATAQLVRALSPLAEWRQV
jgi:hypothetical protein